MPRRKGSCRTTLNRFVALSLLLFLMCPNLLGWGREGHQIIASVAENHLDETTKVMVQSLIGNNHLYSIAPWADDVRRDRPETKTWHYVNIPAGENYSATRDCKLPDNCIVSKISELVLVLTDKTAPREQRAEALKFLVHFVGDIHQPLHAAKEAGGGNGIHLQFLNRDRCGPYECNLHSVWDTTMILQTGMNRWEYTKHEEELIAREHLTLLNHGTPEQWANESRQIASDVWVNNGANLNQQYLSKSTHIVDRQLALSGLRLAALLNSTIGKLTPRDFSSDTPQPMRQK